MMIKTSLTCGTDGIVSAKDAKDIQTYNFVASFCEKITSALHNSSMWVLASLMWVLAGYNETYTKMRCTCKNYHFLVNKILS